MNDALRTVREELLDADSLLGEHLPESARESVRRALETLHTTIAENDARVVLTPRCGCCGGKPHAAAQVRLNDDATLDEVAGDGGNLEQCHSGLWWLQIGDVAVWLTSKRSITATYERRSMNPNPSGPLTIEPSPAANAMPPEDSGPVGLGPESNERMPDGMARITAERQRQVEREGYDAAHDAEHSSFELIDAAACYNSAEGPQAEQPRRWPWDACWWKPKGRIRNLERAGALYLAAADRAVQEGNTERAERCRQAWVPSAAQEIDRLLALPDFASAPVVPRPDYMGTPHYRVNKFVSAVEVVNGKRGRAAICAGMELRTEDLAAVVQASAPLFTGEAVEPKKDIPAELDRLHATRYRWMRSHGLHVARDVDGDWTCWLAFPVIPMRSQTEDPGALLDALIYRFPDFSQDAFAEPESSAPKEKLL